MVTLYVKSPCQYSEHAIAALDSYNVPFIQKNIADPMNEAELLQVGGRHKVPFLVDGDVHLYESEDIIAYIEMHYGKQAPIVSSDKDTNAETCDI
jgi:glutathione S-transferase